MGVGNGCRQLPGCGKYMGVGNHLSFRARPVSGKLCGQLPAFQGKACIRKAVKSVLALEKSKDSKKIWNN